MTIQQLFSLLAYLLAVILLHHQTYGQTQDDYTAKIDSLIKTTNPRNFNGVILITKEDKIKYAKAYGYADIEKQLPLTTKDNFIIMSNSKQVTAVLVLREVEKGKIDLQSPVRKYLPDLPQTWADTVTVHQLLNFSAGITDIDKPLIFRPSTDFKYGNTTYIMLGKILEKVTGKKYIDIANTLFKELKMKNTFCFEQGKRQKRVRGYRNSNNQLKLEPTPIQTNDDVAAAGVISNVADLHTWDKLLHKGKILHPTTYLLMTQYSIMAQHIAFGKEKIGYGYGIRISDKTPIKYIGHTGGGAGFVSFKVYFPKSDVGIIILENQSHENIDLFYEFEIKIKEIVMYSSLMKNN